MAGAIALLRDLIQHGKVLSCIPSGWRVQNCKQRSMITIPVQPVVRCTRLPKVRVVLATIEALRIVPFKQQGIAPGVILVQRLGHLPHL